MLPQKPLPPFMPPGGGTSVPPPSCAAAGRGWQGAVGAVGGIGHPAQRRPPLLHAKEAFSHRFPKKAKAPFP